MFHKFHTHHLLIVTVVLGIILSPFQPLITLVSGTVADPVVQSAHTLAMPTHSQDASPARAKKNPMKTTGDVTVFHMVPDLGTVASKTLFPDRMRVLTRMEQPDNMGRVPEMDSDSRRSPGLATPLPLYPFRPLADNVSGVITQSTTWTAANSPYTLTADVTVATGVTLTIEPGVVVKGRGDTVIRILGHLQAVGTALQPIIFTSASDSNPEQWEGLLFNGGTGHLRHATVRYAGDYENIFTQIRASIRVQNVTNGEVRIESSQIISGYEAQDPDYGLYVSNSTVAISDTLFSGHGNSSNNYALYATGASTVITVTNSTFQDNNGYGLYTTGGANAWVSDSNFIGNGSYPLRTGGGNLHRVLSGNTFTGNTPNHLLTSGTATANATFPASSGLEGYELENDLTVATGVTLTIEPGVVVKGRGDTVIRVLGHLQAVGTALQPITFTSKSDSNPEQWEGLLFNGGTGHLRHATVRYAGDYENIFTQIRASIRVHNVTTGEVRIESSQVISGYEAQDPDYGLYVSNSTMTISDTLFSGHGNSTNSSALYATGASTVITITDSVFRENMGHGVVAAGVITVTNSTFENNGRYGLYTTDSANAWVSDSVFIGNGYYPLRTDGRNLHRVLHGNTFTGNIPNLLLTAGTMTTDVNLSTANGLEGYELENDLTVATGVTLTIEPGVVVKGRGDTVMRVLGHLQAVGTASQPITFTSASDSNPEQWEGLLFDGGTGHLRHTTVRYAGDYENVFTQIRASIRVHNVTTGEVRIESSQVISGYEAQDPDYGLYVSNSTMVISDTLFSGHGNSTNSSALYATGTGTVITVTNSIFRDNKGNGLYVKSGTVVTVAGSTIQDNGNRGIQVQASAVVVENSCIAGNANFGIENLSSSPVVLAVNNWWGHPTGPYHSETNPDGLGDTVSDFVSYDPWLAGSPGSRQPAALALGQTLTGIASPNEYQDYYLVITPGLSLVVEIAPLDGAEALWVYGRLDDFSLWTRYDYRVQEKTSRGTYELLISPTQDRTYYFSVYGRDVAEGGGEYQITANTVESYLSDLSPRSAGNAGEVTLSLWGLGFVEDMSVELRDAGLPTQAADEVTLASPTTLWTHFDLNGVSTGVYDIYAIWPDAQQVSLEGVFTITQGAGQNLEVSQIAPESVRMNTQYVLKVDYTNAGDSDMPTPLLKISAQNANLKLPDQTDFDGSVIEVLGVISGGPTGVIPPAASGTISLIFTPTSTAGTVKFTVTNVATGQTLSSSVASAHEPEKPRIVTANNKLTENDDIVAQPRQNDPAALINNSQFVALEMYFPEHITAFLASQPGLLKDYTVLMNGKQLTATDLIWQASFVQDVLFEEQRQAGLEFDLNPKLVIALLESVNGVVSGTSRPGSIPNLLQPDQLFSLTEELGRAYVRYYSELPDEDKGLAATRAVQDVLNRTLPQSAASMVLSPTLSDSVTNSYAALFGTRLDWPLRIVPLQTLDGLQFPAFKKPTDAAIGYLFHHIPADQTVPDDYGTIFTGDSGYIGYSGHRGYDYWPAANTANTVLVATFTGQLFHRCRPLIDGVCVQVNPTLYSEVVTDINGDGIRDFKVRYDHLSAYGGTNDSVVEVGNPVGIVGNSGTADVHLHFETLRYTGSVPADDMCIQCQTGMMDPFGWWGNTLDPAPGNPESANTWLWTTSDVSDDKDDSFQRFGGTSSYESQWSKNTDPGIGYKDRAWYTNHAGKWAVWGLKASSEGDYFIEVFIPDIAGITYRTNAQYVVYASVGTDLSSVVKTLYSVDQQASRGQWVRLGGSSASTIHSQKSQVVLVKLENPDSSYTVFDAVRLEELLSEEESNIVGAVDPNDKLGLAGFGDSHIVTVDSTLLYMINFENVMTATAPVQELVVVDYLDPNLDWTTLQYTDIAYGDDVIVMPSDVFEYSERDFPSPASITGTTEGPMVIAVATTLDPVAGRVEWRLKAIDSATGLPPAGALAGFLPPEDGTGRGQGHVSFLIKPKSDVTLGTRITNTASIVFDTNDPIETNEVWNTIGVIADLALTKTDGADSATVGSYLTYTVVVANGGPDAATDVVITDTLPAEATLVSSSASQGICSGTSTVACHLGTIANSTSVTVMIVVIPTEAGTLGNTASVTSDATDPNTANNSITISTSVTSRHNYEIFLPLVLKDYP